jgi:iron-only hydrogenase group A
LKTEEKTMSIKVTINDQPFEFEKQLSILHAAKEAGIKIPTLCYLKELAPNGACRMCLVEVEGFPRPVPSCNMAIKDGMKVWTNTAKIRQIRKTLIELLIANHPKECLTCVMNQHCELQTLAQEYGIRDERYAGEMRHNELDLTSPSLVRDPDKCILCGRCVRVCDKIQSVHAIDFTKRGFYTIVKSEYNKTIDASNCVLCGQCVRVCPTGALKERSAAAEVFEAINTKAYINVAQVAPSISATIGEAFGIPAGTDVNPKLVRGLRMLGFDYVFDTTFAADVTIMEEAHELVERLTNTETLPMISTCCPAWIKFMEMEYPQIIPNMSTCKSPMQMMGALIKSYWAKKKEIDPKKIYDVAIMPCTAKKFEAERPEFVTDGNKNTDAVLTTRELTRMLKTAGIDLAKISDSQYDDPLGESTGAGKIFGAPGGVMEAALRTAYWMVNKRNLPNVEIKDVRGLTGIQKATVAITPELTVKTVATSSIANARKICEMIISGKADFQFVEIMACPGGCINGGGQPRDDGDNLEKRSTCLYKLDGQNPKRCSHENESVVKLYEQDLKEMGSEKAHHLLHTRYYERDQSTD